MSYFIETKTINPNCHRKFYKNYLHFLTKHDTVDPRKCHLIISAWIFLLYRYTLYPLSLLK